MRFGAKPLGVLVLACLLFCGSARAQSSVEVVGEVGGGIYLATGSDRSVARPSPTIQIVASMGINPHFGYEAELLYTRIQLKDKVLPSYTHSRSSQVLGVVGILTTTGRLIEEPAVGYLSVRIGAARIATRGTSSLPAGSWVGRTVDAIQNPAFAPFVADERRRAFVFSPKTGLLVRISPRTALDIGAQPVFIFDGGKTTTQVFLTMSLALSARDTF